jgi:hypothetical protein
MSRLGTTAASHLDARELREGPHDTGYKTSELARIAPDNNLLMFGPPLPSVDQ